MKKLRVSLLFTFAASACLAPFAAAAPSASPALPFEHDFVAALDRARVERKPVFVEAWAPW